MLQISNLHKRFGEKQVLRGIDLCVPKGSIFGLAGQNGAGKTTIMKVVLGLLEADTGDITVNGQPVIWGRTGADIGFLPDVPEFYSFLTAKEYLALCGELAGMTKHEIDFRTKELLAMVGLENDISRIKGFSRGMKQRLGIAQALIKRPKLLICDEPTSALDPIGRREILDLLAQVKDETTILFSTHILSDVERICTEVAFISDGVICLQGSPQEIKAKYRTDKMILETATAADAKTLCRLFPAMRQERENTLSFYMAECDPYAVFDSMRKHDLKFVLAKQASPSLEELFARVVK